MSSGDNNSRQNTPTVAAELKLEKAIQDSTCRILKDIVKAEYDDNWIKKFLDNIWFCIYNALLKTRGSKLEARLRNNSEFNDYITHGSNEEEFIMLLRRMAKQEVAWSKLFENEAFIKPKLDQKTDLAIDRAIVHAWDSEFKGDHASVLLNTISGYLSNDITPFAYARLTTIINSSGTGKSRMVDQLGTETIVVPMCLRRQGRQGFPPADKTLRGWLVSDISNQSTVRSRLQGFIYSLLMNTRRQLETMAKEHNIPELPRFDEGPGNRLYEENPEECVSMVVKRQKRLASAFRERMTKVHTYHTSNPNRETFYRQVIELAEEYAESPKPKRLQEAGEMLRRCIDEHRVLESDKGPQRPLVVLAFDEADTLIDNPSEQGHWNLFSELCQALREIQHIPIFSLFLSTAGRFDKSFHSDPLARVRGPNCRLLKPISEVGFDELAYPALKDSVTIDSVVESEWISHLGRPLFGSYWDNLPSEERADTTVMDYAKQELLDGPNELRKDNKTGSLACLSTRFALEFNVDGSIHNIPYVLVERHTRLCIGSTIGSDKMATTSGSEPLLAEAAYEIIKGTGTSAVRHLAEHPDLNCIDRGRRGELVASLVIMQTYDAARELSRRRYVSVLNFMEALLPSSKYNILRQSGPTSWSKSHGDEKTFEVIFRDYGLWINHVIKVETTEMISIDHLWKFVVRGAMILCATNQGVNFILPVVHMRKTLGPDTVTAIIIHVKNERDHNTMLQADLFDAMDSVVKSAIFSTLGVDCDPDSDSDSDSDTPAEPRKKKRKVTPEPRKVDPKAVIRMVFTLASPEPAVVFRDRPEIKHHSDSLTTFDIWLGGLSNETFRQTKNADLKHYQTLLERSLTPHDAFELKDIPGIDKKAKILRRACRQKMAPLTFPGRSHHRIHRNPKRLRGGSGGHPGVAS